MWSQVSPKPATTASHLSLFSSFNGDRSARLGSLGSARLISLCAGYGALSFQHKRNANSRTGGVKIGRVRTGGRKVGRVWVCEFRAIALIKEIGRTNYLIEIGRQVVSLI